MRAMRNFVLFTVAVTLLITSVAGVWMLFFDSPWVGDYLLAPGEYVARTIWGGGGRVNEEMQLWAFIMAMGINGIVAALIGGILGELFGRSEPKPH